MVPGESFSVENLLMNGLKPSSSPPPLFELALDRKTVAGIIGDRS